MPNSAFLTTILGLAASLAAFAILVQITQEVYKYLASSKARAYRDALVDFIGPAAAQLLQPGAAPELFVPGPFQFRRVQPKGKLLPLGRDALVKALERTSSEWVLRGLEALRKEASFAGAPRGAEGWSPAWEQFLGELAAVGKEDPQYWGAVEVAQFLVRWGVAMGNVSPFDKPDTLRGTAEPDLASLQSGAHQSPAVVLDAFRQQFLPHVVRAENEAPQLEANFDYAYRRRNLRQTFIIATVLALALNQPLQEMYRNAAGLLPAEAASLAERAQDLQKRLDTALGQASVEKAMPAEGQPAGDKGATKSDPAAASTSSPAPALPGTSAPNVKELVSLASEASTLLVRARQDKGMDHFNGLKRLAEAKFGENLLRLLGCLLTALLASFGAPFWNDLAGTLTRLNRQPANSEGKD
jgi:hypothetical protein